MKCSVCSCEIPEGKRCCPNCGRVVTAADIKRANEMNAAAEKISSEVPDKTAVYKPASSAARKSQQSTIHIPDIFSANPDAPKYKDPHAYDRATADILKYDRMFVSKNDDESDVYEDNDADYDYEPPVRASVRQNEQYTVEPHYDDENYDDNGDYDNDAEYTGQEDNVIRNSQYSKPRLKFNGKMFVIAVCIIIGLVIIVFGVTQIGKKLNTMRTSESGSLGSAENIAPKTTNEPSSSGVNPVASSSPTGKYTVNSTEKNIFVYKNSSADVIIATIPNKSVIKVDEISGEVGKVTYGSYTGWVKLSDLKYSPDAQLDDVYGNSETTTAGDNNNGGDSAQPGTYTVTLSDDSDTLNVRDDSSTNGNVIATVSNGDTLTVTEVKSGWGKVSVDGVEGWVYMQYLK